MRNFCMLMMLLLISASVSASVPARTLAVDRQSGIIPGPGCEEGIVLDDGTAETAYGWVPSAVWGEYVQTFPAGSLSSSRLDSACICWTRTRIDDTLDFEVVVYSGSHSTPNRTELYSFPATISGVPAWPDGIFVEVQAPSDAPTLNAGSHHIGVRWNPSADQFFFVCADQSPTESPAGGYFRDDRAGGEWADILNTGDPIFSDHAALLVRVRSHQVAWIPTLGTLGLLMLVSLMAVSGWIFLRSR